MVIETSNEKINSKKIKILSDQKDLHNIRSILGITKEKINIQD